MSKHLDLETIPKVASSQKREERIRMPRPQSEMKTLTLEGIPKVDEQQAQELWDEVQRKAMEQWSDDNITP